MKCQKATMHAERTLELEEVFAIERAYAKAHKAYGTRAIFCTHLNVPTSIEEQHLC